MNWPTLYLAPMAGISDVALRELCVGMGAQMTFTEMVSAKGIAYKNARTAELLRLSPVEEKAVVQLFGSEPDVLAGTAKRVEDTLRERLYGIDINMGCPAPKIVNNGEGSALMADMALAGRIVNAVCKAACVPVSVKFRKGIKGGDNAVEFAKMAEGNGASAVAVHGRTREEYYSGAADWDVIGRVKAAVSVRVIGSGDVFTADDVKNMLCRTGCDAVMVARGAIGNPFLFAQARELLGGGKIETFPTAERRIAMCLRQAALAVKYKGEKLAMLAMRSHTPHYVKGMKGAAALRVNLVKVSTYVQLEALLHEYLDCLN